jgi:hypothetical protein
MDEVYSENGIIPLIISVNVDLPLPELPSNLIT